MTRSNSTVLTVMCRMVAVIFMVFQRREDLARVITRADTALETRPDFIGSFQTVAASKLLALQNQMAALSLC